MAGKTGMSLRFVSHIIENNLAEQEYIVVLLDTLSKDLTIFQF